MYSEVFNMTKVLLITPPFTQPKTGMKRCILPMGVAYIAAYLEKFGHTVKIIDSIVEGYDMEIDHDDGQITFGLTDDEIRMRITEFDPEWVGVSCLMTSQAHNSHRICKIAKEINPKVKTIVGGAHSSSLPDSVMKDPNVDHITIGEGEKSILDVIEGRKSGRVKSELIDIDTIPWPARHLLPMEKYIKINMPTSVFSLKKRVTQVETSRGCPFECVFCCTTNFWGKTFRGRDPHDVVKELKFVKDRYKVEEIDFTDPNMITDKQRFKTMMQGMKGAGLAWANPGGMWAGGFDIEMLDMMKAAGCYQITFAIESSSDYVLKKIIKKPTRTAQVKPLIDHCKKIGIDTHAFFVTGWPGEPVSVMKQNYHWAKKLGITSATFNLVQPLPGSDMYDLYAKEIKTFDKVNMKYSTIPHPEIGQDELEKMVDGFNRNFNSSIIYRNPKIFVRKYVTNFMRRASLRYLTQMFTRQ
jgi:radical SAM superfamily enzyme YgiQ (UPF0313 family)